MLFYLDCFYTVPENVSQVVAVGLIFIHPFPCCFPDLHQEADDVLQIHPELHYINGVIVLIQTRSVCLKMSTCYKSIK